MLEIEDALKAKRTLDDWLQKNKASPLTSEEARTLEAILLSPAGKNATANLRDTLWLIRDLVRCGTGPVLSWDLRGGVKGILEEIETYRDERGYSTTRAHLETARALLTSPIDVYAGADVPRLDASVTLLLEIRERPKGDAR